MKISIVHWGEIVQSNEEFFTKPLLEPFRLLKERLSENGHVISLYEFLPVEESDCVVFFDSLGYGNHELVKKSIEAGNNGNSIYFALEPPVVAKVNCAKYMKKWSRIFKKVACVQSDLDNCGNIVYFAYTMRDFEDKGLPFGQRKLLTSVSGNKNATGIRKNELYSERIKAYRYFEKALGGGDEFAFYGTGWDKQKFPSYQGKCESKGEVLGQYKFSICYENMNHLNGYITEKIFDAIKSRNVPIYLGADDITQYVPADCFINKNDFPDYDSLKDYLLNFSEQDFERVIANQQRFLHSEAFKKYTAEYFATFLYNLIMEDKVEKNQIESYRQYRFAKNLNRRPFRSFYYLCKGLAKKILRKK